MAVLPTSVISSQNQPEAAQEPLSWSVHQLRRRPQRLPGIAAALLGVLILGLCFFHSFWLALLPVLGLLLSVSEFVFPVYYTLTAQSASMRYGLTHLEIPWSDVKHAYLTGDGIKLSPLAAKNSRFEGLRGVYLRFGDDNQDFIIEAVKRMREEYTAHGE